MTISTTNINKSYNGNGSTHSFAYDFPIFANADLTVIVRSAAGVESTKTLDTHYIVTGAGEASGGNILFKFNTGTSSDAHHSSSDQRPASGETVLIRSELANTQTLDLVANDPFPASSFETALDKLVRMVQQHEEELDRSIKLSRTNTMTSTEFATSATDRASKVLAFDSTGELSVTTELGTFKGNWGASTTYALRDLVKDTSTNNIFICVTAHSSSGSQPLTTNTDSAKWSLLVDAASATTASSTATTKASEAATSASTASGHKDTATTKASEAASSATASASSATASASSATAAATSATAAATALDNFNDIFLGAKSSDPSTDNDGDALTAGDIYFNTSTNNLKIFNGSAFQNAAVDASAFIGNVSEDSSPQLGGNLDVVTHSIVTTSNRSITLAPNGTGDVHVDADTLRIGDNNVNATVTTNGTGDLTISTNAGTNSGTVVIADGANGNISITPNGTGSVVIDGLSMPQADGSANQILKTNGSGVLSFVDDGGGGGSFLGDAGGGTADIIRVHQQQLDTDVTVATGTNGLCAGTLTLASGVTLTVASGAELVIV